MARQGSSRGAAEFLDALHELSVESEDEILSMSQDEVRSRLAEESIDLSVVKVTLANRLKAIQGERRLAVARERRLAREAQISSTLAEFGNDIAAMKAEIRRRLEVARARATPLQTSRVAIVFNRFQEASDEDLPGLLEDLNLLEDMRGLGSETDA